MATGLLVMLLLGIGGNIFSGASPPESPGHCPPGWTKHDSRCYIFQKNALEWADAEKTCNSFKGHLTSIQDSDQYQFLRKLIFSATGSNTQTWVGGTNAVRNDLWMWTDGTQFTFTSWGHGEPNNQGGIEHCMEVNLYEQDYVNDVTCSEPNPFICVKHI